MWRPSFQAVPRYAIRSRYFGKHVVLFFVNTPRAASSDDAQRLVKAIRALPAPPAGELMVTGQTPLACDEVAVHQVVLVGERVRVLQAELMTQLVHHRAEQVDVAGRYSGRIGLQPRCAKRVREFGIVGRVGIEVPAIAGGICVNRDVSG